MTKFNVAIVERPAIRAAGLKIRTSMENAGKNCMDLWENKFGPRMDSFPVDPARPEESYGLSIMADSDNFDYWAAMPVAEGAPAPAGMDAVVIPGGIYGECHLESLAQLADALHYLYETWGPALEKYAVNAQGAGYELYTDEYLKSGALTLYCPLLEK